MSPMVSASCPVARKTHYCTNCGHTIIQGERYHRWTGTSEMWDGLATAKECAACCERYGRPITAAQGGEDG